MAVTGNLLPNQIMDGELSAYFDEKDIIKAVSLIKNGQVTLSFSRGSPEQYFIVSGIVKDRTTYETRLKFKRPHKEANVGIINSQCACEAWKSGRHCGHVASLFLKFYLQSGLTDSFSVFPHSEQDNVAFLKGPAVYTTHFGTIIDHHNKLKGAGPNSTFASNQYLLTNNKVIHFPIPKEFEGKLKIDLQPFEDMGLISGMAEQDAFFTPKFWYVTADGEERKNISLLGHLYLFDWSTGEAWHLSDPLKDLVRKWRHTDLSLTLEDYLRITSPVRQLNQAELVFQGKNLTEYKTAPVFAQVSIHPGNKRNHLSVDLEFYSEAKKKVPVPQALLLFVFENGLLSSFRKKSEAYHFLVPSIDFLCGGDLGAINPDFKKYLRLSDERELIQDTISYIQENASLPVYDQEDDTFYLYDSIFLRTLFKALLSSFGESFFRFSSYRKDERKISYELATTQLLSNITAFHSKVSNFGVQIFYNNIEVRNWNSRVKFERKGQSMEWFELELDISADDLAVIKNSEMENNFALTNKGLVLFTPEEQELVRFMKKYIKYDKTDEIPGQGPGGKKFVIPFNRSRIFELYELKRLGLEGTLSPEEIEICEKLLSLEKMPHYPVPEKAQKLARPYQITGYQWLRFLYDHKLGACLADDMGLGKTFQAIVFLESVVKPQAKVLIVCPVSILINWQNEFKKFSSLDIEIYYGGGRTFPEQANIVLTSYGVLKREIETTFQHRKFDIFIMDEVHHLKNLRSQGATAARKIQAQFRMALTGTPVENDLSEFYNIIDLCIPGIWGNIQYMKSMSFNKGRQVAKVTAKPFILRRNKAQVLSDLPEKTESHVYLNFSTEEAQQYAKHLFKIRDKIQNAPSRKKYGEVLKGLLELRQLCLWQSGDPLLSTKIEFLLENLEQIVEGGNQVLVFSQFTKYLDIIQRHISHKGWKFCRIDGTQNHKKRQHEIDSFQKGEKHIFLISLKAGGVGLNLTAASYIFLMDPWWNPAVEAQAIDRAHRIGQKNKLTVYRPIIKDTVEEKVLKLQEAKRELFHELMVEDEERFYSGKLTMTDFEILFGQ